MNAINRALLAVVLGVAISVLLAEAVLALLAFVSDTPSLARTLATGDPIHGVMLIVLSAIWLASGSAGGAMVCGLSRLPLLAVPVGVACGLPLALTAMVGLLPLPWVLAMGLSPLLGSLLGAQAAVRLQRRDQGDPTRSE